MNKVLMNCNEYKFFTNLWKKSSGSWNLEVNLIPTLFSFPDYFPVFLEQFSEKSCIKSFQELDFSFKNEKVLCFIRIIQNNDEDDMGFDKTNLPPASELARIVLQKNKTWIFGHAAFENYNCKGISFPVEPVRIGSVLNLELDLLLISGCSSKTFETRLFSRLNYNIENEEKTVPFTTEFYAKHNVPFSLTMEELNHNARNYEEIAPLNETCVFTCLEEFLRKWDCLSGKPFDLQELKNRKRRDKRTNAITKSLRKKLQEKHEKEEEEDMTDFHPFASRYNSVTDFLMDMYDDKDDKKTKEVKDETPINEVVDGCKKCDSLQ